MRTGIVAFLAGNMALLYWPYFPNLQITILSAGITLVLTLLLYRYRSQYTLINKAFFPSGVPLVLFVLWFISGFLWTALYIKQVVPPLDLEQIEGQTIRVTGEIATLPKKDHRKVQFVFNIHSRETIYTGGQPQAFKAKVYLSWYGGSRYGSNSIREKLKAGQIWQLDIRLKHNNGLLNPGGFDYELWLFQNHIQATGYVRKGKLLRSEQANYSLFGLRQKLADTLDRGLAENPYKGLFKALAIGSRADISPQQWQLLMRTGTNHLIAISGLHIGLFAALSGAMVFFIWRRIAYLNLRFPAFMAASVSALLAAVVYAALAGFAIPTQRALLMLLVVFAAVLLRRTFYPSYVLLSALFLVLLIDPLSSLSFGFWLSFSAVAVIVMAVSSRLASEQGRAAKITALMRIQMVVFLGLLPLTAIFFNQFSLVAPVANLVAVPFMSLFIIPLTLAAAVLSLISETLAGMVFNALVYPMDILFEYLNVLDNTSHSVFHIAGFSLLTGSLLFAGLWLLMPRGWPGRPFGLLLFLPLIFTPIDKPENGTIRLTMLDVGQGLAMVVQTRTHSLVFDTGDNYSQQFNMADSVIIPFLNYRGISLIDRLIISHTDRDHAGSFQPLYEGVNVKSIMSGEAGSPVFNGYPVHTCQSGQHWIWDGVRFEILSPLSTNEVSTKVLKNNNNLSCVLLITTARQIRYLLTGDIEKHVERQLLMHYPDLKADVLQVPHHGSKTSSGSAFIKQLEPQMALFSHGYRNRFHHPSQKVVQKYRKKAVKIYTTVNGAIDIQSDITNNSLLVIQYRELKQRFWHRQARNL